MVVSLTLSILDLRIDKSKVGLRAVALGIVGSTPWKIIDTEKQLVSAIFMIPLTVFYDYDVKFNSFCK